MIVSAINLKVCKNINNFRGLQYNYSIYLLKYILQSNNFLLAPNLICYTPYITIFIVGISMCFFNFDVDGVWLYLNLTFQLKIE